MSAPITINVAQLTSASSPGLYVPIHKRTGSNTSSRPSSPSSSLSSDTSAAEPSTYYSTATLLALRPLADESIKGKILVTCPEVVMTRKMRKGLEFKGSRVEALAAQAQQLPSAASETGAINTTTANPTLQAAPIRILPRRSRPTGRAPERRRFGSRRGLNTGDDWRLHPTVPISPVLIV